MRLVDRLAGAPREQRSMTFQKLWGRGDDVASLRVDSDDQAMRLAAVWGCVRIISEAISSLPVDRYRRESSGARVELAPGSLLLAPSQRVDLTDWLVQAVVSLLLRGNAYGLHTTSHGGYPTTVEWLHPDEVDVRKATQGWGVHYFVNGVEVPRSAVTHVRGLTLPGDVKGLSVLGAARVAIGAGLSAEQFGADFFASGGHPTSILSVPAEYGQVDDKAANALKERFVEGTKGREPAVLSGGTSYTQVQVAPDDSQFIESQRFTATQIATFFGVPPSDVGGSSGDSLTYHNEEHRSISFTARTLRPWIVRLERALTAMHPRPQFVKFNTDAGIRMDSMTRVQKLEVELRNGVLSRNEWRALDDKSAIPDPDNIGAGNEFIWPPLRQTLIESDLQAQGVQSSTREESP